MKLIKTIAGYNMLYETKCIECGKTFCGLAGQCYCDTCRGRLN